MTLEQFKTLLLSNDLEGSFSYIIELLLKRIDENQVNEFVISENVYPKEHFLEICESRLDYINKKQLRVPRGFKELTNLLKNYAGLIRIAYIISDSAEKFVLYFEEDLDRLIGIYCKDHIEPIVLKSENQCH